MSDLKKIAQKTIEIGYCLLLILVPLIMTPWNFELFEFNKMLVVYVMTALIVGAWLIKMLLFKRIIFRRTFWDLPLIIFFLSQAISLMFSIDKLTSFWGYYGRFNGGLLSVICYLLLYWAFVSNMAKRETRYVIRNTLIVAAVIATYGILEHFGHSISCLLFVKKFDVSCWVQDVQNRVFATIGQPNWLAAYLVALIPLAWAGVIRDTQNAKRETQDVRRIFVFLITYLCLLYTQSRSGFLAFGISFLIFWGLSFWQSRKNIKIILRPFLTTIILCLIITFISRFPPPNQQPINPPSPNGSGEASQPLLISESSDIRKIVWKGAIEIWRHFPILGTGPETFAYSYYWFRPREHNDLSEWDFLYNKAHNEYLNYAATTGTVGLISYLLLIGSFIFYIFKKLKNKNLKVKISTQKSKFLILNCNFEFCILNFALLSGFVGIIITNFFGFSVVITSLFFFLFPAFAAATTGKPTLISSTNSKDVSKKQWVSILLIILITSYLLLITYKYWLADKNYSLGEKYAKATQFDQAFLALQKAIKYRPSEPIYHDELALTSASLAVAAFKQNNATLSAQLTNYAISESDKALQISASNLNFWKNRTKVFYKMAEIDGQYLNQAFDALQQAAKLAPTDAKIKYNLALLYAAADQNEIAIKTLEETIILKPNYEDARLALALFYEQANQKNKAKEQYQYILDKINPANQQAKEKLK